MCSVDKSTLMMPFNRTIVELKQWIGRFKGEIIDAFNRTIVELKLKIS